MHHPCRNRQTHRLDAGTRSSNSSENGFRRWQIEACHLSGRATQERMAEFFVAAQHHGFAVEPLSKRRAYINGKLCIQRQACWHAVGNGKHTYTVLNIHAPKVRFDVCAWKLPDGRFLILPNRNVARNADYCPLPFCRHSSQYPPTSVRETVTFILKSRSICDFNCSYSRLSNSRTLPHFKQAT